MILSEEQLKKRNRNAKILKVVSGLLKTIPSVIRGIAMIGLGLIIIAIAPYITGDKVFDEEVLWTQSQLMGAVVLLLLLYLMGFIGGKKI